MNPSITTGLLGKAGISGQKYENSNGTPLTIDYDFFGKRREKSNPTPGPIENLKSGKIKLNLNKNEK